MDKEFHLYNDIRERTGGEIYIGVVGPVRTGKSTFIKRFMDVLVLPNMEDRNERSVRQMTAPVCGGQDDYDNRTQICPQGSSGDQSGRWNSGQNPSH